jgi:hypothetical protein
MSYLRSTRITPSTPVSDRVREKLSARVNHDLAALCRYLREKEREHPDRIVTLEPRRPELVEDAKK